MTTGIITGWVLVHDGVKVLVSQYNEKQETAGNYNIETFETEGELTSRVVELGLEPLPDDEEESVYA